MPKALRIAVHVAGHGAIAEGNQDLGALADLLDLLQVLHVRHGAFHQRDVGFRELLEIGDRAKRTTPPCCASSTSRSSRSRNDMWQPEQPPSQTVAKRGFACLPDPLILLPGAVTMYLRKPRLFSSPLTDLPFSNSAPVGQTCTHLPQLVHVSRLAPGSPRSVMTQALGAAARQRPRCARLPLRRRPARSACTARSGYDPRRSVRGWCPPEQLGNW